MRVIACHLRVICINYGCLMDGRFQNGFPMDGRCVRATGNHVGNCVSFACRFLPHWAGNSKIHSSHVLPILINILAPRYLFGKLFGVPGTRLHDPGTSCPNKGKKGSYASRPKPGGLWEEEACPAKGCGGGSETSWETNQGGRRKKASWREENKR